MAKYTLKYDLGAPTFFKFFDISNCTMSRKLVENEVFERFELSGKIDFYGDDFDIIYDNRTESRIPVELYKNNVRQAYGFLVLNGKDVFFDVDRKQVSLEFETSDQYSTFFKNIEAEFDITSITNIKKVKSSTAPAKLEFSVGAFTENSGLGSLWYDFLDIYARQSIDNLTSSQVAYFIGRAGWELKDGTTDTIIRDWTYQFPAPNNNRDFYLFLALGSGYSTNEQYPDPNVFLSDFTLLKETNPTAENWSALNNEIYYSNLETIYSQTRILTEIVTECVKEADPALTFVHTADSSIFDNILIGISSDMKITDGELPSNYTKLSKLTVKELLNYLKTKYYLYYKIDSDKNISFYYKPNLYPLTVSALPEHDTTTYKNINWTKDKNRFTLSNNNKFRTHRRTEQAIYTDFQGVDAIHYNVNNNAVKEIINGKFIHDLQGFEDVPDEFSINNSTFVAMQCNEITDSLLIYFQNSWSKPIEEINRVGTYTGGNVFLVADIQYLENSSSDGALISNSFAGNKGDTLTFSMRTELQGLKWQIIREYEVSESLEDSWVGVTNLTTVNANDYSNTVVLNQSNDNFRILIYIELTGVEYEVSNIQTTINNTYSLVLGTGALSGIANVKNAGLSLANLDNAIYADASDKDVILNNNTVELPLSKVVLSDQIEPFEMPINKFASSFDFEQYVVHEDYASTRIGSISMKCDLSDICEVSLFK